MSFVSSSGHTDVYRWNNIQFSRLKINQLPDRHGKNNTPFICSIQGNNEKDTTHNNNLLTRWMKLGICWKNVFSTSFVLFSSDQTRVQLLWSCLYSSVMVKDDLWFWTIGIILAGVSNTWQISDHQKVQFSQRDEFLRCENFIEHINIWGCRFNSDSTYKPVAYGYKLQSVLFCFSVKRKYMMQMFIFPNCLHKNVNHLHLWSVEF